MKTNQNANGAVQGTIAKTTEVAKSTIRPNLNLKDAKNEPAKDEKPVQTPQGEKTETAGIKTANSPETSHESFKPAGEPQKPELKLDDKLKALGDLHRISVQRINLLGRIAELERFEIAQAAEADELEANPYQGCKLIIEDDKGRKFVTNTPNLIRMVAQFIFEACEAKRKELEAKIVFPA
ncbi:hypothetical protein SAMN05216464_108105 [Mucilaginibacter pineti]|uniref:Uncharacterized protein n=1 Tax=Mucilaginibacter pineti TaxID=1391627 RepID=A0A1G7EPL0_9SPHI|nr:hypothetical protein [Mucilaginibacter pineti]SDE65376.1 hypothetical protein SAMN05216464_108105 [Mucilaginibacter pineti]